MTFVWTAWWNALPRLSQFYHDIKTKSEDIEYLKCYSGWIAIYNGGILSVRLVPQNFVWKASMKRQKALNRIPRYHGTRLETLWIIMSLFMYSERKINFRTAGISLKQEIFTPARLSRSLSFSDYLEEALVPIKRLGFSQRKQNRSRDDINSSESVHVHELTILLWRGIKRLD